MKFFQNRNKTGLTLVVMALFIAIVSMLTVPSFDELLRNSKNKSSISSDLEKKTSENPIPEKDSLEEITEEHFSEPANISYLGDYQILLVNHFLLNSLPNCTCDVYTPPPKQTNAYISSQIIG